MFVYNKKKIIASNKSIDCAFIRKYWSDHGEN